MSTQQSSVVIRELAGLEKDRHLLSQMTMDMWKAADASLYPMDLYANGAINRSFALSAGFETHIRDFNLICAGALLRLQLDTGLRFYAASLVPDADHFAMEVLKGVRVDKLKDRDGHRLRDAYLVERIAPVFPWAVNLYEKTSGYVHMSNTHMHSAFGKVNREECSIEMKISWLDKDLPDDIYLEFITAFRHSTELFAHSLAGWIVCKRSAPLPPDGPTSSDPSTPAA